MEIQNYKNYIKIFNQSILMHSKQLIKWLKDNNLDTVIRNHNKILRSIPFNFFDLKKDQEFLIIGD